MLNNATVPTTIQKLFKIVDGVLNHNIKYLKNQTNQDKDCYGYYIDNSKYNIDKKYTIWFGVDYEIWNKDMYPLIIQIYSEEISTEKQISKLENIIKFKYKNGVTAHYMPFGKDLIEENDNYISEEFANKISRIINQTKLIPN